MPLPVQIQAPLCVDFWQVVCYDAILPQKVNVKLSPITLQEDFNDEQVSGYRPRGCRGPCRRQARRGARIHHHFPRHALSPERGDRPQGREHHPRMRRGPRDHRHHRRTPEGGPFQGRDRLPRPHRRGHPEGFPPRPARARRAGQGRRVHRHHHDDDRRHGGHPRVRHRRHRRCAPRRAGDVRHLR